MSVPILYVFRGWEPYLETSVRQAMLYNPASQIFHVTTSTSRLANGARRVDDAALGGMAERFHRVYRHMSVNPTSFERFCFQRWMVAYEAMCQLGLESAVLMDGDVLLWADVAPLAQHFSRFGMTWTEPDQPGTAFVANREVLRALCESMIETYSSELGLRSLAELHAERQSSGQAASISDMTLLGMFKQANPTTIGNNGEVVGGGRFDHNMNESDGFETRYGLKRFVWKNRLPFARSVTDASLVRFYSMHFVGRAKGYMEWYAKGRNLNPIGIARSAPDWVRARIPSVVRKVRDKIRR